jgi:hydroxymethylbilane synthase
VLGERAFLNRLGGSCQVPIAGHGEIVADRFNLTGLVAEVDGSRIIKADISGPADSAESIGVQLAEQLLAQGADRILEKLNSLEHNNYES